MIGRRLGNNKLFIDHGFGGVVMNKNVGVIEGYVRHGIVGWHVCVGH